MNRARRVSAKTCSTVSLTSNVSLSMAVSMLGRALVDQSTAINGLLLAATDGLRDVLPR
jgi:hypothetical protein